MVPVPSGRNRSPTRRRRTGGRGELGQRDDGGARRRGKGGGMARADALALLVLGHVVMVPAMMAGGVPLARRSRAQLCPAGVDGLQRDAPETGRPGQEEQRDEWEPAQVREHRGNLAVAARRG